MKTITINVSEPVYRGFKEYARLHDRTTSALIREAMEEYLSGKLLAKTSLRDLKPVSVGRVLQEMSPEDDLLGEMLNGSGR